MAVKAWLVLENAVEFARAAASIRVPHHSQDHRFKEALRVVEAYGVDPKISVGDLIKTDWSDPDAVEKVVAAKQKQKGEDLHETFEVESYHCMKNLNIKR